MHFAPNFESVCQNHHIHLWETGQVKWFHCFPMQRAAGGLGAGNAMRLSLSVIQHFLSPAALQLLHLPYGGVLRRHLGTRAVGTSSASPVPIQLRALCVELGGRVGRRLGRGRGRGASVGPRPFDPDALVQAVVRGVERGRGPAAHFGVGVLALVLGGVRQLAAGALGSEVGIGAAGVQEQEVHAGRTTLGST